MNQKQREQQQRDLAEQFVDDEAHARPVEDADEDWRDECAWRDAQYDEASAAGFHGRGWLYRKLLTRK